MAMVLFDDNDGGYCRVFFSFLVFFFFFEVLMIVFVSVDCDL